MLRSTITSGRPARAAAARAERRARMTGARARRRAQTTASAPQQRRQPVERRGLAGDAPAQPLRRAPACDWPRPACRRRAPAGGAPPSGRWRRRRPRRTWLSASGSARAIAARRPRPPTCAPTPMPVSARASAGRASAACTTPRRKGPAPGALERGAHLPEDLGLAEHQRFEARADAEQMPRPRPRAARAVRDLPVGDRPRGREASADACRSSSGRARASTARRGCRWRARATRRRRRSATRAARWPHRRRAHASPGRPGRRCGGSR